MKKTFKNITKLGILFFGISLAITSCQKDDNVVSETPVKQNKFTVTKVNSTIINNDFNLVTTLDKITPQKTKTSNSERVYYNEIYGFEIDTNQGVLIEDNTTGLKHYTFAILNSHLDSPAQNIIIKENLDGAYSSFISEYTFTEREYYANPNIDKSNVMYFPIDLDANLILNDTTSRCIAPHWRCLEVWGVEVSYAPYDGDLTDCTQAEYEAGTCIDRVPIYTDVLEARECWYDLGSGCGGGGTTSGTTGTPGSSGPTGLNGSGSDPDDGLPELGANDNPIVTTPIFTKAEVKLIIQPFMDELDPQIKECIDDNPQSEEIYASINTYITNIPEGMTLSEYTSSSQLQTNTAFATEALTAICAGEVDTLEDFLNKIPCDKLNDIIDPNKANITPKLEALKTTLAQGGENGVQFSNDSGTFTNTDLTPTATNSIDFTAGGNNYGGVHTHPITTYPMFSWSDVYNLFMFYQNGNASIQNEVTFMLVSSPTTASTGAVYAITIDSFIPFRDKMIADLNNIRESVSRLNFGSPQEDLRFELDNYLGTKYAGDIDSEKVFLEYFKEFNISLYKANDDISDWNKLELQFDGSVAETPCN